MAVYDGMKAAFEHLTEVAKACALAAAKAPAITHRLNLKMEIITEEDIEPIIDVLETLGKTSAFQLHDAVAFRQLAEQGKLPPVLLLGADLTEPALWDCGACGFATCGEYLKYVRRNKGVGLLAYGPSCVWKAVDYGIACDYACACAAQHHAEARIMGSFGAIGMLLGRLEGASFVLGLPIGPVGQHLWFDREAWKDILSFEQRMLTQMAGGPTLSMAFSGGGNPILKTKPRWWEDPAFMKIEQDETFVARDVDNKAEAYEKIMKFAGVLDDDED
jgi:uncharacterized ferredoxin-like protein